MNLDQYIASTQRWITYAYIVLFGGAFASLIVLPKPMDETVKTIIVSLIAVLGTVIVQQSNFWFARVRTSGVPASTPKEELPP